MGWWSATIMGGDSPIIYENEFQLIMGLIDDDFMDDKSELCGTNKALIEFHINDLFALAGKCDYVVNIEETHIRYQVLAKMILASGAKISDQQRDLLYEKCKEDEETYKYWEDKGVARKFFVDDLLKKIKNHKEGVSVFLESESLVDKINEYCKEYRKKQQK